MKRKTALTGSSLAVTLALMLSPLAQAQEPLFGTWKMNPAKSKYSPGPVPKSNIAKWEADDAGWKVTVDIVPVSGETQHWEASGKFDGKDNPLQGNPDTNLKEPGPRSVHKGQPGVKIIGNCVT